MPDLYRIALDAESAWQAELTRLYGKGAGDMRYRPGGTGTPGTVLNRLYVAWKAAMDDWRPVARELLRTE